MKKLNAKKNTNKPEIPGKVKKGYRIYVMAVLALTPVSYTHLDVYKRQR